MGSFREKVERLKEYIEKTGRKQYTTSEVSSILSVSPNYAREIMKVYAVESGKYVYTSGMLLKVAEVVEK